MITLQGKAVCGGVAFGKIFILSHSETVIKRRHVESATDEIERFEKARARAETELGALYEKAVKEVGKANAMIFQIHRMMLEDVDYLESIRNIITDQMINAETAVGLTCDTFVQMFESMEDSYMRERSADVKDVSERLIRILEGKSRCAVVSDEPVIVAADNLAPSETVQLDKSKILAFVTAGGSANSHAAILAKNMNIPAVVGVNGLIDPEYNGRDAVIDGFTGTLYIEPDDAVRAEMRKKLDEALRQKKLLERLKGKASVTKDGKHIAVAANIENVQGIAHALMNDAEGIGLFRSEFLYLESRAYPTEDTQFEAYREVLTRMENKRVVIRTFDIGADKRLGYLQLPNEENPAMGLRAIRLSLKRPQVFKTQLRALYRASVFGNLAIMFPMITSEWEIDRIIEIIDEVKAELKSEGAAYSDSVELGCMIETPAAAIMSDALAKKLDFFSIGTNDLTQYTLAADRQNPDMADYFDNKSKAVLRLVDYVIKNAHQNGLWVSIRRRY